MNFCDATAEDIDFLTQQINAETPAYGTAYPFGFVVRSETGDMIAGVNGSIIYGALYTDQLWVHPNHRGQGMGRHVMEHVHNFGRSTGCTMATATTMSFQGARTFYEALGYRVDFERQGYAEKSSCLFLHCAL